METALRRGILSLAAQTEPRQKVVWEQLRKGFSQAQLTAYESIR